jgi:hypothetical protein
VHDESVITYLCRLLLSKLSQSQTCVSKVSLWNVDQETKLSGRLFNIFSQYVQANAVTYISYATICRSLNSTGEWPTVPYVGWRVFTWYSYPITGPDMRLGQQEVDAPKISRQSAHECGNVVIPMHQPSLTPRSYPWYSFLLTFRNRVSYI